MGGLGSGRWRGHMRKPSVDEAPSLDVNKLHGLGAFKHKGSVARLVVTAEANMQEIEVRTLLMVDRERFEQPTLQLTFEVLDREVQQFVPLTGTRIYSGGYRPWFFCHGQHGETSCGRRVSKLHLMNSATSFLCRQCCGLVYRQPRTIPYHMSAQERPSRRLVDAENEMNVRGSLVRQIGEHERRLELLKSNLEILDRNEKEGGFHRPTDLLEENAD